MAIAFISMYALGSYMVDLDYYDPWYHRAPELHKSTGILLVSLMLFRFTWNKIQPRPVDLSSNHRLNLLSRIAHNLFYVLVLALFVSGYLISTAKGKGIDVFEWFNVPALFNENSERGDMAGDVHFLIATSLMLLAIAHATAAMYHHFVLKDNTLKRMFSSTDSVRGDKS
jgi:cytochrome b561